MNLDKYQQLAETTAIYPGVGENFIYVSLGLTDELAELLEKTWLRAPREEIEKELGDVMWYLAQSATELKVPLNSFFEAEPRLSQGLDFAQSLIVIGGSVNGISKKSIRDDGGKISDKKRDVLCGLLTDFAGALQELASSQGLRINDACVNNIDKLQSRKTRGVLGGSGDNR